MHKKTHSANISRATFCTSEKSSASDASIMVRHMPGSVLLPRRKMKAERSVSFSSIRHAPFSSPVRVGPTQVPLKYSNRYDSNRPDNFLPIAEWFPPGLPIAPPAFAWWWATTSSSLIPVSPGQGQMVRAAITMVPASVSRHCAATASPRSMPVARREP